MTARAVNIFANIGVERHYGGEGKQTKTVGAQNLESSRASVVSVFWWLASLEHSRQAIACSNEHNQIYKNRHELLFKRHRSWKSYAVFFSQREFIVCNTKKAMNRYSNYIKLNAKSILLHIISISWPNSLELLTAVRVKGRQKLKRTIYATTTTSTATWRERGKREVKITMPKTKISS